MSAPSRILGKCTVKCFRTTNSGLFCVTGMGNVLKSSTSSTPHHGAAEGRSNSLLPSKNRRYSQSSAFSHWSDHIKEKKVLTISLKETGSDQGMFTLSYTDESSDNFFTTKTHFVFSGRYQHQRSANSSSPIVEELDVFGVKLPVDTKGDIILEEVPITLTRKMTVDSSATLRSEASASVNKSVTRFFTEKLTCKLAEGELVENWVIVQSTQPNCLERTAEQIKQRVSWNWPATGVEKTHNHYLQQAPPGTLDFIGEELIEGQTSSIDLRIRFPQLQAWLTPPVLALNETTGWKLARS